jgi:hypothetical protein
MVSTRNALAVLCAAALVACDGAADAITGPDISANLIPIETEFLPGIPVLDPFAPTSDVGVIESARGGAHYHIGTDLRTFAFTAKTRADGTTQGQYQVNNRSTGFKEHGTVSCLVVDGNEAWVGGIITNSNVPGSEGFRRVWRVVDRGEGSDDPPDQMSPALPVLADACDERMPLALQDIEGGNIQVRDAP